MFQLITPGELKENFSGSGNTLVVDARRKQEYEAGHIAAAVNICWEDWCEPAPATASSIMQRPGWWGKLAHAGQGHFAQRLTEIGIGSDTRVVVYADGPRSRGRDARIAWMLLYLGVQDVFLVNGGWRAWLRCDGGKESPVARRGGETSQSFVVKEDLTRRIFLEDIDSKDACLSVDTRSPGEYQGGLYGYQPRLGRIPGSINIPFSRLYQENCEFVSHAEFLKLLSLKGKEAKAERSFDLQFSYCEVGVRASAFSLLYELYTGFVLPVYDGSFMEWSLNESLPIEKG